MIWSKEFVEPTVLARLGKLPLLCSVLQSSPRAEVVPSKRFISFQAVIENGS